ncbi:hypothetical protein L596_007939 [Steinernema carpocapsae]|uniref:C-type lectin domain-containing protein n=1 Tax=Steinernema carpocapsae TaxID=34508 RepID=A0A4U5PB09_STECR|nr:hypothetical protein L596_007939 [Steinernema carpocapsae]
MPRLLAFLPLVFGLVLASQAAVPENRIRGSRQPSAGSASECPRNWIRYERTKSCFLVIEQRLRWNEAERYCNRHGGHLASLVDEYENYFAFGESFCWNSEVSFEPGTTWSKKRTFQYQQFGSVVSFASRRRAPTSGTTEPSAATAKDSEVVGFFELFTCLEVPRSPSCFPLCRTPVWDRPLPDHVARLRPTRRQLERMGLCLRHRLLRPLQEVLQTQVAADSASDGESSLAAPVAPLLPLVTVSLLAPMLFFRTLHPRRPRLLDADVP